MNGNSNDNLRLRKPDCFTSQACHPDVSLRKVLGNNSALSLQNSTDSASKFQPVTITRSSSQPGTITINISLSQVPGKCKRSQTLQGHDETIVCEICCEQTNDEAEDPADASPTCDLGVGTCDIVVKSDCFEMPEKPTTDYCKIDNYVCDEECCLIKDEIADDQECVKIQNYVPEEDCRKISCKNTYSYLIKPMSEGQDNQFNGAYSRRCDKPCSNMANQRELIFSKQRCNTDMTFKDVCEEVECLRKSKIQSCTLCSHRSTNTDPRESLKKMITRSKATPSWKFRTPDQGLMKIDESTDAETPGFYQGRMGKSSRFCEVFMGAEETATERSIKITCDCKHHIREMYEVVGQLFRQLYAAADMILSRDFSLCSEILSLMQTFQEHFIKMIKCLRYSPYEDELLMLNCGLDKLFEELEVQPAFVLVRMIEFGYSLFEIGRLINEEFIPPSFVALMHKIQTRLYGLQSGRVIRQIYFVPSTYDPIVSTYYKSRQMLRIENLCRCKVVLLSPEDPRAVDCPIGWRCLEVNFDEQHGRHLAFKKLLHEACPVPASRPILSVATVFRRLNGSVGQMSLEELCNYEVSRPRISMKTLNSDIHSKSGLASLPRLRISEH